MKRVQLMGVLFLLVLSLAACRPRPAPGPATAGPASPTAAPAPAVPAPTPTPALPGLGDPVPADVEPISLQNLSRLQPIWRTEWPLFSDLIVGQDALIARSPDGIAILSASDLQMLRFISLPGDFTIRDLAIDRSGRWGVVTGGDGVLFRVDLSSGKVVREGKVPGRVQALAFVDSDGHRVAVLADGLRIWDPDGSVSPPQGMLPQKDYKARMSSDGRWALVVETHGAGALYEVPTGTAVLSFSLPVTDPVAIALHPHAEYAAVAASNRVFFLRLDAERGKAEVAWSRDLSSSERRIRGIEAGNTMVALLFEEKERWRSSLEVVSWEEGRAILSQSFQRPIFQARLDEAKSQIYLLDLYRLEARDLKDGRLLVVNHRPPTGGGMALWEQSALITYGIRGYPDLALLDLQSGRIRWQRSLDQPIEQVWVDPYGKWLAVRLEDGSLQFMDPGSGDKRGVLSAGVGRWIKWIGVDSQGRGLIGLQQNKVILWIPGESEPRWQHALPVSQGAELTGAVSEKWIAVATVYKDDAIWVLDHDGYLYATIRDPDFTSIYKLQWFNGDLVAYRYSGSGYEALVLHIPSGEKHSRLSFQSSLLDLQWWPDRKLWIAYQPDEDLSVFKLEETGFVSHRLRDLKSMSIGSVLRLQQSAAFLTNAGVIKITEKSERRIWFSLLRKGFLLAFDVDNLKAIWEQDLSYYPNWIGMDPGHRWLVVMSAFGRVEVWGVR